MRRVLGASWPALLAVLVSCSIADGEYFGKIPTPDPRHFRWCGSGEPEYIDPALATSTTDMKLVYALFDGLTDHDPDGLPEPSLATSWDISPDQKTFTFHLRRDAVWSNGRPIVAADFVYSLARVLHPLTASANSETLWKVRHGKQYNSGTAKLLLRDAGPFRAGDVVEVLPEGKDDKGKDKMPPDSNLRRTRGTLPLRPDPDAAAKPYATVPGGEEVTVVELGGADRGWAYVHHAPGDGVFGWAPLAELDEPHAARDYRVRALDGSGRTGAVKGRDVLMLPDLLGLRAPDPHTLVIETEGPTPYLIDLTLQRAFRPTPREAISRWPKKWTRPDKIVTSGPFHLVFWRQRDKFELVKSRTFWGRDQVRLDRVTIYSMNDASANASTYYQGGCDAVVGGNVPASWYPVLEKYKDYTRAPYLGIYFYLVNVERLDNVHLRRALSHALDRSRLPMLLKGGQIPTEQFIPGTPFAKMSDEDLALCGATRETPGVGLIVEKGKICYVPPFGARHDLELARKELELARQQMGAKFPKKITIKFNTGFELHKHIAEWVQHEWKRHLGIEVELESQEWKTYLKDTRNRQYDVGRMGWIGNFPDPEGEFLSSFRCKSPDNRTGYCDEEFDRLYEQAEQEPDRRKRLEIIRRAEERMIAEQPIIPLYVYTQHHLQKPYVRELSINLYDQQSLRRVWIDPDWRSRK